MRLRFPVYVDDGAGQAYWLSADGTETPAGRSVLPNGSESADCPEWPNEGGPGVLAMEYRAGFLGRGRSRRVAA